MIFRVGIVIWAVIFAVTGLAGCATGGTSGANASFMGKCTANAKTAQERSECAWKNADRMASGN